MALVTTRQKQSLIGLVFGFLVIVIVGLLPYILTRKVLLNRGVPEDIANVWGWVAEGVIYGIPLVLGVAWLLRGRRDAQRPGTE